MSATSAPRYLVTAANSASVEARLGSVAGRDGVEGAADAFDAEAADATREGGHALGDQRVVATSSVSAEAEQGEGPAAASASASAVGETPETSAVSVVVGPDGAAAACRFGVVVVGPHGAAAASEVGVAAVGEHGASSASNAANSTRAVVEPAADGAPAADRSHAETLNQSNERGEAR